jgi:predicted O-methyltransferase YrrM
VSGAHRALTPAIGALLVELEAYGRENDAAVAERESRMLNITRDTGELLRVLVHALNARQVLEIGTSNGYSTVWLGVAAAALGGNVSTVERNPEKVRLAMRNLGRAGLVSSVALLQSDATLALRDRPSASVDLLFLDADRVRYVEWWPDIDRVLRVGALLVVDNALSHEAELAPFVSVVSEDGRFLTCTVPVGNGEYLAVKTA